MKEIDLKRLAVELLAVESGPFKTKPKTLARAVLTYFDPEFFFKRADEQELSLQIANPRGECESYMKTPFHRAENSKTSRRKK